MLKALSDSIFSSSKDENVEAPGEQKQDEVACNQTEEEDEIISDPGEDIPMQANCLGCGASISYGKDDDITRMYCDEDCKPKPEQEEEEKPAKLCKASYCKKPLAADRTEFDDYCGGYCYVFDHPDGVIHSSACKHKPAARCKYCDKEIGEEVVCGEGDYCSELCKNEDVVKPEKRTTRRSSISSDRQLMFNRLESEVTKAMAKEDRLETPYLTDYDKAHLMNLVKQDYRTIPDIRVNEKQNFILHKVPYKVSTAVRLYKESKKEKQRRAEEFRKQQREEKRVAQALKRAENKRKAAAVVAEAEVPKLIVETMSLF